MKANVINIIKLIVMVIAPAIAILWVFNLERLGGILRSFSVPFVAVLFIALVINLFGFVRRCKKCAGWFALKEVQREEITRMEMSKRDVRDDRNGKRANHRVYRVRYSVKKECRFCGAVHWTEDKRRVKEE